MFAGWRWRRRSCTRPMALLIAGESAYRPITYDGCFDARSEYYCDSGVTGFGRRDFQGASPDVGYSASRRISIQHACYAGGPPVAYSGDTSHLSEAVGANRVVGLRERRTPWARAPPHTHTTPPPRPPLPPPEGGIVIRRMRLSRGDMETGVPSSDAHHIRSATDEAGAKWRFATSL